MIIDCQLKSLLKNYLKTLIVGFGQADALGLSTLNFLIPQVVYFYVVDCKVLCYNSLAYSFIGLYYESIM